GASGGNGGGAIAVLAQTGHIDIDGTINMNGTNGLTSSPGGGGGGAGGSVLLIGATCDIDGTVTANGGDGGDDTFDGGGGGGGRVSVLYTQGPCNLSGTLAVAQGTSSGGQTAQVGTYPEAIAIPYVPAY